MDFFTNQIQNNPLTMSKMPNIARGIPITAPTTVNVNAPPIIKTTRPIIITASLPMSFIKNSIGHNNNLILTTPIIF